MIEAKKFYINTISFMYKRVDLHIKQGEIVSIVSIWCGQNNITTNFRTLDKPSTDKGIELK
jgi:hypothetical protein